MPRSAPPLLGAGAPRGRRYDPPIAEAPTGQPPEPPGPPPASSSPSASASADGPTSTLRGAGVATVDIRRLARVFIALGLLGLAVLVVILFVAGAHKNSQISELRQHGVPVNVRISGCLGLLGGSGSNQAGYSCKGSFTLDGRSYSVVVPGNILREPGTIVPAVTVRSDPHLLDTAKALAHEHSSPRVFILPGVLLVVLLVLAGLFLLGLRRLSRPLARRPTGTS